VGVCNQEPNVTVRDIARSKSVKKNLLEGWVKWVIFFKKTFLTTVAIIEYYKIMFLSNKLLLRCPTGLPLSCKPRLHPVLYDISALFRVLTICFSATESEQRCFLGHLIAPIAETEV